jgi:hypothetical protein
MPLVSIDLVYEAYLVRLLRRIFLVDTESIDP